MGQDRQQTESHGPSEPISEHRRHRRAASLLERIARDSDSSRRHVSGANTGLMPVWELTSLAATPKFGQNPGSRRMVQMEVAFKPPLIPPAPISPQAPVALQGSFVLNAYDFCSCTCTTPRNGPSTTLCRGGPSVNNCATAAHAIYRKHRFSDRQLRANHHELRHRPDQGPLPCKTRIHGRIP